jgi:hypothetical protein
LCAKISSNSSACLILIDSRTELIEGSIRTFSEGLRAIVRGVRRTSGVDLRAKRGRMVSYERERG